jgi:hypothetical protein
MNRVAWLALVGLIAFSSAAVGQVTVGGTIRGTVTDDQGGALPGVTVTATSPTVPGVRTVVTDSDGSYRLLNLPPAVFSVEAELQGFSKFTQPGVEVRAGLNLTVDVRLSVGTVSETVTVSGVSPVLETERAIQSVNIAGDFQMTLPLTVRHDLTDALEVTPGVTSRSFIANNGTQVYMVRGTDVEQHVVQIDGADMGSSRQGRTDYVNMSTFGVADTQVTTGGADATVPIGLGVVMDVTSKSGTDQLRGNAGSSFQGRAWNADNAPGGIPTISNGYDAEAALGGPVAPGRMWFFGSYRYFQRDTQISRNPSQLSNLRAVSPGWQPFDNHSRNHDTFLKLATQVSPRHQLNGFVLHRNTSEEGNQSTNIKPLSAGGTRGIGVSARLYSAWTNTLTTTVSAAHNTFAINGTLDAYKGLDYGGPSLLLYTSSNTSAGRVLGNGLLATTGNNSNFNVSPSDKTTFRADVNWYKTGWAGSHEFQGGVFLQPGMHLSTQANYLNNGFILEEQRLRIPGNLGSGYVPFHRQYVDQSQLSLTTAKSNAENYAAYVQDAWKVARLTATIGLRVDTVIATDELFDVQTQSSTQVAPRFGATYALTEDSLNIVHGAVSRIIAKPEPAFLPSLGGAVSVTLTDIYDTAGNGTFSTVLTTPAQSRVAANRRIDPDRHQEFADEFLLGYRRQFPMQISFDATFIRRYYREMPAQIDINGIYENGRFGGYLDQTQNAILLQTNNVWNTPVYTGLELMASQRTRVSQFVAGYTRAYQHLDGTWQPNDPAAFIQPETFANDRGIGSIRGGDSNSLSGVSQTRNPMWLKHALRVSGSYQLPGDFTASTNLVIMSGPYTGPIVTYLAAPDPRFGPATLTLPNGRVVSNPLGTTVRFAYPTRGAGQLQAPTLATWNARLAWSRDVGGRSLEAALSVVNITNRDTQQEFLGGSVTTASTGSNQIGSPNFAYAPDGSFQGQNRQAARAAQMTLRIGF